MSEAEKKTELDTEYSGPTSKKALKELQAQSENKILACYYKLFLGHRLLCNSILSKILEGRMEWVRTRVNTGPQQCKNP